MAHVEMSNLLNNFIYNVIVIHGMHALHDKKNPLSIYLCGVGYCIP